MTSEKMTLLTNSLLNLEQTLKELNYWNTQIPSNDAFNSTEPFALDHLEPTEWLQWIFIPKMHFLIQERLEMPTKIAISPYIEEAMKEEKNLPDLLAAIKQIETILVNI